MMNKTLLKKARCMTLNAGLSKQFCAEAIFYTTFIANRLPCSGVEYKTPMDVWSGFHASYDGIHIFGCPTYYHVPDKKLDPKAQKTLFFGTSDEVKGFKL